jgi:hypothetical protein
MTSTTSARRRLRAPAVAAAAIAGLVLVLGACSGSDDDAMNSSDGGGDTAAAESGDAPVPGSAAQDNARSADGVLADDASANEGTPVAQRAVISTATVSLTSDDVADARFDVQKLVDQYRGEVAEEQTEGGEDMRRSRMVIRIPSGEFDRAVAAFEKVGALESSTRKSEDVTTKVIDTAARIRAQEESLQRVEVLLARATSIRDIVAIEAQLTRRQADLDSLKSQQAFLADQTSLSTITVHIERTKKPGKDDPDTDDTGFFAGLENGWDALTKFGTGVATVAGAVLPFALVFGLIGVPVWLVWRRLGRRRTPQPPVPATT